MVRNKILFMLVLFIFLPNTILAEENEVTLQCPNETMIGNEIECKINLDSQEKIKGILLNYKFDETFSYLETNVSSNFENILSNNQGLTVIHKEGITNSNIATLKLIVSNDAIIHKEYKINLNNISLSNGEKDIYLTEKEETLKVLSITDIVDSIYINNAKLEVKDGITDYTIEVDNYLDKSEIVVNLKSDKYKFISGYGSRTVTNLKVGDNIQQVKITNQEENVLVIYNINIKRKAQEKNQLESVNENPKTGTTYIYLFLGLLLISSLIIIKYKKRLRGNDNA